MNETMQLLHCPLVNDQICTVPLGFLGLQVGDQVRVSYRQEVALYTVRYYTSERVVKLNGSKRLGLGDADESVVADFQGPCVVNQRLSDAEAEQDGEFVERLVDDGSNSQLICIAPHGGCIDLFTDKQAEYVLHSLSSRRHVSLWLCKGFRKGGGAFSKWHTTSNDISPNSFPSLHTIANRKFQDCISFHGMNSGGVLIGGLAPMCKKERLKTLLQLHLPDYISVRISTWQDCCNGLSKKNVCNWLTQHGTGGIQLEQDRWVRQKHWQQVAAAVVDFYSQDL